MRTWAARDPRAQERLSGVIHRLLLSSRRPPIIWAAVLSHHHAYRSVHGGSMGSCVYPHCLFHGFQSLLLGALEVSLSSTLLSSFSCVCITAISYQSTFFSLLWLPLFSPSRSVCSPSTRDIPLHGTTASADFWTFSHTSLYGLLWISHPCAYRPDLPR